MGEGGAGVCSFLSGAHRRLKYEAGDSSSGEDLIRYPVIEGRPVIVR